MNELKNRSIVVHNGERNNIPKQQGYKCVRHRSQAIHSVTKTNVQSQSKTKNKNQSNQHHRKQRFGRKLTGC